MTISRRKLIILLGSVFLAIGSYTLASSFLSGTGFPLDDAWIHQTYARNLAQFGEWSFIPGWPSGGSTAPLWSALIAPVYLVGQNGFVWTMLLGGLGFAGRGMVWREMVWAVLQHFRQARFPWAGLFLAFEWHLVWAAASGMETILFAAMILFVFWQLAEKSGGWLVKGLLVGLIVWLRPDGLTLLGPIAYVAFLSEDSFTKKLRAIRVSVWWFFAGIFALSGIQSFSGWFLVAEYIFCQTG